MKRILIGTTAAALAMAWAVVPISQAQPQEMQEECDPAVTQSAPQSQAQPQDSQKKCNQAPAPSVPLSQAQPQKTQDLGMKKALPNPQAGHSERSEETRSIKRERPTDSLPVRKDKEMAMRKPCREMNDREMDGMCGGITGSFDIAGDGSMTLNDNSTQSVSLSGQAQQNLSSMVNIISINSTISVMMNLNININSTVGTVNQGNTGVQNTGVQNTFGP